MKKLCFKEIKPLIFGAAVIKDCGDDGIELYKCTEKQIEAWDKFENKFYVGGAKAPTGIMADMHTNSDRVVFSVWGDSFEILIDGQYSGRYTSDGKVPFDITVEPGVGEHRVTLEMPSHGKGKLMGVAVDDNADVRPHKYRTKMMFLGDSITQGWNSGVDCLAYAHRVADFFNAERLINGIGGTFFYPESFDTPDFDPDTVIVAYGTNDFMAVKDIPKFKNDLNEYLGAVANAYKTKELVLILPIHRFDYDKTETWSEADCRTTIKNTAEQFGFKIVDGYTLVPKDRMFYADDVHPNALGFGMYAQNLIKQLINSR